MPWWLWLVPVLWAGAFLVGSAALNELDFGLVSFLRFAVTVACGVPVFGRAALAVVRARPGRRAWAAIVVLSLTGGAGYHLLFYAGLARTAAPVAAIIIATNPLFTALGAAFFLKDRRATPAMAVGLCLAFLGALLLSVDKAGGPLVAGWGWGETLCLLAAMLWASSTVLLQRFRATVLKGLPGPGVTYLGYVVTALLLAPFAVGAELSSISFKAWSCLLYIGLLSTLLAYTLFNLGVDRVGSARTSQVAYAVPALTTLLSVALVPTFHPGWLTWAGLVLVTGGLVGANRQPVKTG
jgi:drug/metabolite transporter (DMT)-like permease